MNKNTFAGVGLLSTVGAIGGAALIANKTVELIQYLKDNARDIDIIHEDGQPFENSRYYREGDYAIHYRIDPACTPTVRGKMFMIHGFACNTTFYDEMVEIYTHYGFTCVRVDVPNCGNSTRENENVKPIDREDLFLHLIDVLDASGEVPAGKWILIGHSMGGGISLNIAYDAPEKFLCDILYAPMAAVNAPQFVKNLVTMPVMANMCDSMFRIACSNDIIMRCVVMLMTVDVRYSALYDVRKFSDGLVAHGSGAGMCYMMARARPTLHENMAKVEIPVQLVWGKMDLFNAKSTVRKFQGALRAPQVSVVPLAGHCLVQNAAREVCDGTVDFLKDMDIIA